MSEFFRPFWLFPLSLSLSLIQDTVFCKSILNEYAVKMNLEMPTYTTIQPGGVLPVFVSNLVFNGATYTGDLAKSKKEAEQLAARAVIQSIMGILSKSFLTNCSSIY